MSDAWLIRRVQREPGKFCAALTCFSTWPEAAGACTLARSLVAGPATGPAAASRFLQVSPSCRLGAGWITASSSCCQRDGGGQDGVLTCGAQGEQCEGTPSRTPPLSAYVHKFTHTPSRSAHCHTSCSAPPSSARVAPLARDLRAPHPAGAMGRGRKQQQRHPSDADDDDVVTAWSEGGSVYRLKAKSAAAAGVSKDPVAGILGGQYDPEIVDEVQRFRWALCPARARVRSRRSPNAAPGRHAIRTQGPPSIEDGRASCRAGAAVVCGGTPG